MSKPKSRTAKTRGVNERLLKTKSREAHGNASLATRLAAPTSAGTRAFLEVFMCPFCGNGPWKSVASHTYLAHAVTAKELRAMAGLSSNDKLTDPDYSRERSDSSKRMASENPSVLARAAQVAAEHRKRGNYRLSDAGHKKIAQTSRDTWARRTPEDRAEQERNRMTALLKPDVRQHHADAMRQRWENPTPAMEAAREKFRQTTISRNRGETL